MSGPVHVREAAPRDLGDIARIYNEGIRDRTATFETRERTAEELRSWLGDPRHPVLVAEDAPTGGAATAQPTVLGWAAASRYRPRACYEGICEFSFYVARAARGRGTGTVLMGAFLEACESAGAWKLVSRVFPQNRASRIVLARHGFREVGTYLRHARLDGAWRDVVIVERLLGEARHDT